jgi:hypothetical protein
MAGGGKCYGGKNSMAILQYLRTLLQADCSCMAAVCSDYEVTGDRDNDDDDRSFMFAGVEPSAA